MSAGTFTIGCLQAALRAGRAAVLWGIVAGLLFAPSSVRAASPDVNDRSVTAAVEEELLADPAVPSMQVGVWVDDGVVTLTGVVDNVLAKDRSRRVAETVKGVRAVVNRLQVAPRVGLDDPELADTVEEALTLNAATDAFEVSASAEDGVVTLEGRVDSFRERQLSAKVAKGVAGVRAVENRVQVSASPARSDAEIREEVRQALHWDRLVDAAGIQVEVEDRRVRLSGTVGSAAEKGRAVDDAWVLGVSSVEASDLEVADWARDPHQRRFEYEPKSDAEVEDAIRDALGRDPLVEGPAVDVSVSQSTVTLRGSVNTLQARRSAGADARATVGAVRVVNRLRVRPTAGVTDAQAAARLRAAIRRDPYLDRYEIASGVSGGKATLHGTVDTYFEKARAENLAARIRGIQAVENHLGAADFYDRFYFDPYVYDEYEYEAYPDYYRWYRHSPPASWRLDADIRDDVRDQMFWSPFVDEEEVTVSVEDGVVTLTGTVESRMERDAAEENAYEGGAALVRNRIEVQ